MSETILQSYLNAQHIKTSNETHISNLRKAITEVKKQLEKKKTQIIPYTLIALDPKVSEKDPVVEEVERIIIKKWSTFKNNTSTKDKSTTYVRAVILESLNQLAKNDIKTACMVWHTARDVVKYYRLEKEVDIVGELLQDMADRTETEGHNAWGMNRSLELEDFQGAEISIDIPRPTKVNRESLHQSIYDAIMHSGWGGENPGYPHQGNQTWSNHAIEHLSDGIESEINSVITKQNKSLSSISNSIKKSLDSYFTQLKPFFNELNTSFVNSITANNKRGELLWWKEALYSPKLKSSYRELDPLDTAILMVFDLADLVEPIYPISVDFLLKETLKKVHGEQVDKEQLLSEWLKNIKDVSEEIKSYLAEYTVENNERKTLLVGIANNLESFFSETGIDKNATLSLVDLSVWLFHGLQAHTLAASK